MDALNNFCDAWLKSWTGNKPDILLDFYHDQISYCDPGLASPILGRENLGVYFQKLLKRYPDWIWVRKELFPIKDGFCLIWSMKGLRGMDVVILKDNKIIRNEVYFDMAKFKMMLQNQNQTN